MPFSGGCDFWGVKKKEHDNYKVAMTELTK